MNKHELLRDLESIYKQLGVTLQSLKESAEGSIPQQSLDRYEAGLCVRCGDPVPAGMKVRRGCDEKCHRKTDRMIKAGEYTDAQAVTRGYWLPDGYVKTGRPTLPDPPPAKKSVNKKK